jgi:hypothetical protein
MELLWSWGNPWFRAVEKLTEPRPETILPLQPDLYARGTMNSCIDLGFSTIAVPIPSYRFSLGAGRTDLKPLAASCYTVESTVTPIRLIPVAVLGREEVTEAGIDALLSACGKADALHLLVDMAVDDSGNKPATGGTVERLIGLLAKHRQIDLHRFSRGVGSPARIDPTELMKFVEPVERSIHGALWERIEDLRRKKRKTDMQMRELLKTVALSGVPPSEGEGTPSPGGGKRDSLEITNISMAGSVTLVGVGLQAAFSRGRLSNLIDHGEKILPGIPGRSFFTFEKKRKLLETESAFSFDRDGQTGLRSILSGKCGKAGEVLRIVLDYAFTDERRSLTVDMTVHYPPLPTGLITESSPLEVCLGSFCEDDTLKVAVQAPDREPYNYPVSPASRTFVLSGKTVRLRGRNGDVQLQASPRQATRSEQIEFRVERRRTGCLLWCNLGGSYLPQSAANLSDRSVNLSYEIGFSGAGCP